MILFSYSFWNEFTLLFADMSIIAAICLLAGLMLCVVEIFQPSYGILGGLGAILLLIGVGLRVADNGSLAMLFILVFFIILILLAAFLLMVFISKRGWLMRTPLVEGDDEVKTDNVKDYYFLLNMEGVAETELRPYGRVLINGRGFDVVTNGTYIDTSSKVKVIEVEGTKIVVKQIG